MSVIEENYDVVVAGGGLAGVCAALASTRGGAVTASIQNHPVLEENVSSEVRMCICGVDAHGTRLNARETEIVKEFLLKNRRYNVEQSFSISGTIFWEMTHFQENLDLYLNTWITQVETEGDMITAVSAVQITNEKEYQIDGKIFADSTGDGFVRVRVGAEYMKERKAKTEFNEPNVSDTHGDYVMGITLMFKSFNTGRPVKFEKPFWANTYIEEDLKRRGHCSGAHTWQSKYGIDSRYWWIELGGGELGVIEDIEEIRDELLKILYGVWDHLKNGNGHGAENYVLDWVQFPPAKRESQRITGDYVLNERDLLSSSKFQDAIVYGSRPMDMHAIRGMKNLESLPIDYIHVPDIFQIPYRCYYSKNIKNLMMTGRCISVSHMAHGSTRMMGACGAGGQAVGVAAALTIRKQCLPRDIGNCIEGLQQQLLRDDCYISDVKNSDAEDKALLCTNITATLWIEGKEPWHVVDGIYRNEKDNSHCWQSGRLDEGQSIILDLGKAIELSELILCFDTSLGKEISLFLFEAHLVDQTPGVPPGLVKDFTVEFLLDHQVARTIPVLESYVRMVKLPMGQQVCCDQIRMTVTDTYRADFGKICEIRAY